MNDDNIKSGVGRPNPVYFFLFLFPDMGTQSDESQFSFSMPSQSNPHRSIGRKDEVQSERCLGRTLGVVTDSLFGLSRNGGLDISVWDKELTATFCHLRPFRCVT